MEDWRQGHRHQHQRRLLLQQGAGPAHAQAHYGRIVNIASIAGKEGNPNASAYSTSKAGGDRHERSRSARRLAKTKVTVNCVTPAAVRTAIFQQMSQQHIDFMLAKIPMGAIWRSRGGGGAYLLDRFRRKCSFTHRQPCLTFPAAGLPIEASRARPAAGTPAVRPEFALLAWH